MIKYVVWVQMDLAGDKFGEYTGIEHDEYCDAVREMKEALSNDDIYHAWIREEEFKPLRECWEDEDDD